MANEFQTTSGAELILDELLKDVANAFSARSIFFGNLGRGLINVGNISGMPTKSFEAVSYTALSITSMAAETTDLTTKSDPAPASTTLTVARKACRVDISDLLEASVPRDLNSDVGAAIAAAYAEQVDTDILGVMTTNHTSSVGATNASANTPEQLLSALMTLSSNKATANGVWGALHPKQIYHIKDDLLPVARVTTTTQTAGDLLMGPQFAMNPYGPWDYAGIELYESPLVGTGTDGNDIYCGIVAAKGAGPNGSGAAIAYAIKEIPNKLLRFQEDISAGTTEVVLNYYDSAAMTRVDGVVLVKSSTY